MSSSIEVVSITQAPSLPKSYRYLQVVLAWLVALQLVTGPSHTLAAGKSPPATRIGSARELLLPEFQTAQLRTDSPVASMTFDDGDNLWIAGKKSIWRWQLQTNQLQKIQLLGSTSADQLQDILIHENQLYVMTTQGFFQVNFNPIKVIQLQSNSPNLEGIRSTTSGKHLYWITSHGVYGKSPDTSAMMHLPDSPALKKGDFAEFIGETGFLWFSQGNRLFGKSLIGDGVGLKPILTAKHALKGLARSGNEIYVHTRHTVLRYDLGGNLLQTIPVESNRKLVLMNPTENSHLYLFSDKILEVYNIRTQQEQAFHLDIGRAQQATKLVSHGSMVAMALDGKARVFQLSQPQQRQPSNNSRAD